MEVYWLNRKIANSDNVVSYQGVKYFPKSSLSKELFRESPDSTQCPYRGQGKYFDLIVDGQIMPNAACVFDNPKSSESLCIKGMISFSSDLKVI
tara:strand:+ start:111 stop:392 length:282 start_codon:yes stop_codon:yes gene_type:complete